jgi:Tfp pilus assembly protein PilO
MMVQYAWEYRFSQHFNLMATLRHFRQTYQTMIIYIAVILGCGIGYTGGVYPAILKITDLFHEKQQLTQERDVLKDKVSILDSLDENTLRENLSIVLSAVPSDKSIQSLFQTIDGAAASVGIELSDINVAAVGSVSTQAAALGETSVEKHIGAHTVPFSAGVVGSFENIQKFITLAPAIRRLVRIRSFGLQFPKDTTPLRVSLDMDAFYEPFPNTLGVSAQPIFNLTQKELYVLQTIEQFPDYNASGLSGLPTAQIMQKLNPFSP